MYRTSALYFIVPPSLVPHELQKFASCFQMRMPISVVKVLLQRRNISSQIQDGKTAQERSFYCLFFNLLNTVQNVIVRLMKKTHSFVY